ncbi:hypothetical protein PR048_008341 [Dryococelus australis]|uniref:YqaJ viral recombinase domain-containing protein n=1 Tax=Dryococelus australis TaxID=614101 RepID=A0ABQ9HX54_9NEOP|nr:hypothetical protein PR048_008341 [Dryococelus australis]
MKLGDMKRTSWIPLDVGDQQWQRLRGAAEGDEADVSQWVLGDHMMTLRDLPIRALVLNDGVKSQVECACALCRNMSHIKQNDFQKYNKIHFVHFSRKETLPWRLVSAALYAPSLLPLGTKQVTYQWKRETMHGGGREEELSRDRTETNRQAEICGQRAAGASFSTSHVVLVVACPKINPFFRSLLIGADLIIEIKGPSSPISIPPLDALQNYLEIKDGKPQLKLSHNYMYQIQGVLHISQRKTCNFVVWTPEGMVSLKIQHDTEFWENKMVTKLLTFFYDSLLPEIIDPRHPRNMPIRERPHIKSAQEAKQLSDFDKGVIVGCHLSGLSSQAIARKVNRSKSMVAFVLRKWKVDGHCANAARSW